LANINASKSTSFEQKYGLGNMRHLNRYTVIISLIFTALTVEAVQLGSAKGSAVFGRPLDLSVQVRLDAPAEEAVNCFSADVFQADNKFDVGSVRLDVTPAANGLDATVRVRSATAVNEPWAKVILRSNCGTKVSRQYDFLTDFVSDIPTGNMLAETLPALPSVNTGNTTATAKSNIAISQAPVSNWSVKRSQAKATASQQKPDMQVAQMPLAPKKIKPTAPANAVAASGTKKTTDMVADAVGQSRLKMETFELTDEHQVLLKLSTALVAPTGMRTPEEIQALAQATAVWRAINGMPAEVKAVENPALDVVAQAKPAVQAPPATIPTLMNQKLAGKSEFSNLIVYGLIGLLALTLACIAWLWLRVRKASRAGYGWLNDSVAEEAIVDHEPTQFLHSNFYETETTPQVVQDPLEPTFESDREIKENLGATTTTSTNADEIFIEVVEDEKSEVFVSLTDNNQIISPLPPHFDDPRFDERLLRTEKKNRDMAHEQPITSNAELMELVLADSPPKLRSVITPAPVLDDKAIVAKVPKAPSHKDDAKGNLIDFDVFAEPEPLNKPTRFVR
jgi:hypothetical protein